jgi:peptidoglycan/LPS O-acetylase OafA/YrhL
MLHIGQAKMSGSRLRPFMCVGIAYFLVAVIVPLVLIYLRADDTGSWTPTGVTWAFFAGVAGAVGALGVILAFNAGGKPIYVMPLIFGFAPVINTFITLSENGTWNQVQPLFWVSLGVVIAGAVTVLVTAPKPKPKPGH